MRALIALGLAAALVTGCSGDDPEATPSPTPPPASVPPLPPADEAWRTGVFVALPLDAYVLAGDDAQAVLDANRLLMQRCMRERGYTYLASRIVDTGKVFYPYGPTDPDGVAADGYGQPAPQVVESDQPRRRPGDTRLSIAYLRALLGRSAPTSLLALPRPSAGPVTLADGCTGRATLGLGPLPDPDSLVGTLGRRAQDLVTGDPRVRAALDAWSACMDGAGRPYASPMAALARDWRRVPREEQVATALADVACKAASDLPRTWQQAEADAQRPLVAASLAALKRVQERARAQVVRARALLQAGP